VIVEVSSGEYNVGFLYLEVSEAILMRSLFFCSIDLTNSLVADYVRILHVISPWKTTVPSTFL